ncbi:MAG: bifunctional glutamate N-acetyltransferase/amino-acid acetyltransferase ArgJ [Acidimicrobiales bacterium]
MTANPGPAGPAVSPLAPDRFPDLPPVRGVGLGTHAAGLRYQGRDDVLVVALDEGTTVAGVFTRSKCPSAPVDWCRRVVPGGRARALVVNAGNANAFTGGAGDRAAEATAAATAAALGCRPGEVLLASTGVIGEILDPDAMTAAVTTTAAGVEPLADPAAATDRWRRAAEAIRTTDTFAKGAAATVVGADGAVVMGIAKGSGMIAPDMATMLAFVFTDLAVTPEALQQATAGSVERSYNRITVDSDTSTSDTVLIMATGRAGNEPIAGAGSPGWDELVAALDAVNLDLAHQIVRDGEGATRFVTVTVTGAADDASAKVIALAIANSPLVKTALAAGDANWGRIVMAVGKAGEPADRDRLTIRIGPELVARHGQLTDGYSEARATTHLQGAEVTLEVDVGVGSGTATVWTCDLTHGYIEINAGYRS